MFAVARKLGVPMREIEPEPWDVSVRLQGEPRGVRRFFVAGGSRAEGAAVHELPLENTWISMIIHNGEVTPPSGGYVLEAGDEVIVLTEADKGPSLREMFEGKAT
jgi:cell volume regulation protein A